MESEIEEEFVVQSQLAKMLGVSSSTVAKWSRDGVCGFPAPLRIGPNTQMAVKRWRKSDIRAWIRNQEGVRNVDFITKADKQS